MSSTRSPSKRRSTRKKASPDLSETRRDEVLGLTLLAVAALFTLALVSFSPADNGVARNISMRSLLRPEDVENLVGTVGAWLGYVFIEGFLGYVSLFFGVLLAAWGWVLFRHRETIFLPFISVLTLALSFQVASLIGWFGIALEQDLTHWSGGVGSGIASWLHGVFGPPGSFIVLLLFVAVTVLLLAEGDVQQALDRIEDWVRGFADWIKAKWSAYREGHAVRKARREEIRAQRQAQSAADRAAREAERARAQTADPIPASTRSSVPAQVAVPPRSEPARRSEPVAAQSADPASPAVSPPLSLRPPALSDVAPAGATRSAAASAPISVAGEPSLKVQERVQEDKSDHIAPTDAPQDNRLPYQYPGIDLLDVAPDDEAGIDYQELEENKQVLLDKLRTYKIEITDINAIVGPTVTLYELTPAEGVKIRRITELEDDLAMAMAAHGIRIIAPIPGKSAIGVEIPNRHREMVRISDLIGTARFAESKMELPVPIGKSIEGEVYLEDLTKMPHLLIAGATGSGKSVGLNTLIAGLLYKCHPANLKFVLIDPKKIELTPYRDLLEHFIALPEGAEEPIVTDFNLALGVLKSCEKEMEKRYDLLSKAAVRGVKDYNKRLSEGSLSPDDGHRHLPYIVVVVDELADLMMTAGKEIEGPIARLAQMARAVGIHLVLATQRPSVDVITGLIKANFPSRMAYQVASKIDSRTILDQGGAEQLVGNGDLLYMNGSRVVRLQGPYVSMEEVDALTAFIGDQPGPGPYMLPSWEEAAGDDFPGGAMDDTDDYFEEAARIIVRNQQGSVSLLQRKLSIGYTRAARIVDQLEEAGVVGPFEGSKARQVLVSTESQLDDLFGHHTNP